VTKNILGATKGWSAERADLQGKVQSQQQTIATLKGDMEGARTQLASLSDRDALLKKREKDEIKMQEVQAVFKREEADVLLRGDQMIIRMYGLSFPVGSAEIRPENFSLLTKLRRVLEEFPESAIAIEGNTDSQGAEDMNRALSQSRADAVREYLLANMNMESSRVAAVGHGEDRPIANNETEEGRAKNRRIDLTLNLPSN
jgi:OOP family OmpA-OmpF porin